MSKDGGGWAELERTSKKEAGQVEKDPTGKTIGQPGCKVDAGKAPVLQGFLHYFPRAVLAVAEISAFGVQKGYAWNSWETVENGINRYGDAQVRHLVKEVLEGPLDAQSKKLHAAHEAWNSMARLELICREEEKAAPAFGGGGGGSVVGISGNERHRGQRRRGDWQDMYGRSVNLRRKTNGDRRKSGVSAPTKRLESRFSGVKDRRVGHEDSTCPICKGIRGALRKSFVVDRRKS